MMKFNSAAKKAVMLAAALAVASATVFAALSGAWHASADAADTSFIWVLDGRGELETSLSSGILAGVPVSLSVDVCCVSLTGLTPETSHDDDETVPAVYKADIYVRADYDLSEQSAIKKLASSDAKLKPSDFALTAEAIASCNDFSAASSGAGFSASGEFSSGVFSHTGSDTLKAWLSETYPAINPLPNISLSASIQGNINETGKDSDYGIRRVFFTVTLTPADGEKTRTLTFEGTLKRLPGTLAGISNFINGRCASVSEGFSYTGDGASQLTLDVSEAVNIITSLLSGSKAWPSSLLPEGFPEFSDTVKLSEISQSDGNVTVLAHCTKKQLASYRKLLEKADYVKAGSCNAGNSLIIEFAELPTNVDGAELAVRISIHAAAAHEWLAGFENIFPDLTECAFVRKPYGEGIPFSDDYAWMCADALGLTDEELTDYGDTLVSLGFKLEYDEYVLEKGGFRCCFFAASDDNGDHLNYYVKKGDEE